MTIVQTLSDNNQTKLDHNEQQMEQYRTEIETLRRQLLIQQQEYRTEMNERKEILALNRHRYDELIQMTNKALMFHEQTINTLQQLRSTRSTSSTLINQYIIDCQSINNGLQINQQQINNEIQTIFSNCNRLIGQVLTISMNINQQIYILNEKIQAVLSLAFQQFHSIFEEFNHIYENFQREFDQQLKILIEQLTIDIKNDFEENEEKFIEIKRDISFEINNCFQQMIIYFNSSSQTLWFDLQSFLTQRFNQMLTNEFRIHIQIPEKSIMNNESTLDLNTIRLKWIVEYEKHMLIIQKQFEQLIIQTLSNLNKTSNNDNNKYQNTTRIQSIHQMCKQHGHNIQYLIETKLQKIFNEIREEYDQQCAHLFNNIEHDINQMNLILQDINSKLDYSTIDSINLLTKQGQRLDVLIQNLQYDWQMIIETIEKFENETILPTLPLPMPKTDTMIKQEINSKETRLITLENKENMIDGNLPSQSITVSIMPCRLKNDTPFF